MARRGMSRLDLRRASEQAEAQAAEATANGTTVSPTATKTKKAKSTSTTTPKRTRKAATKEIRKRAVWVVFNQNLKSVARFDYAEKAGAEQKAEELSTSQKTPHFVQLVKEEIND